MNKHDRLPENEHIQCTLECARACGASVLYITPTQTIPLPGNPLTLQVFKSVNCRPGIGNWFNIQAKNGYVVILKGTAEKPEMVAIGWLNEPTDESE